MAIRLEAFSHQAIIHLMESIRNKSNYVIQESIPVIRDIFRRYPNQYLKILQLLFQNIKVIEQPPAKAAFIYIISEHIDIIENSAEILKSYLNGF